MNRRALLSLALVSSLVSCGGTMSPAQYPDIRIRAAALRLKIVDPRKNLEGLSVPPRSMYLGDVAVRSQALPKGFAAEAQRRLDQLPLGTGLQLAVETRVERADVSFETTPRGDMTRFDVELGFKVIADERAVLLNMKGAAFNELPSEEATVVEQQRVLELTAGQALDSVFASEATLEKLNAELANYEKSRDQIH